MSDVGELRISRSAFFFFYFCFLTVLLGEKTDILAGLNTPGIGEPPFHKDPALFLIGLKAWDFQKGDIAGELK